MERFESTSTDERAGSIYQTTNYDQFHLDHLNREVDKKHLQDLIANIQKGKAIIQPIQVDSDMNIIDGQHRYLACKTLHKRLYYYVDNQTKVMDADLLNSKSKKWELKTYVERGVAMGNKDYIQLNDQLEKWGGYFSATKIIFIFAETRKHPFTSIKDRTFRFKPSLTGEHFLSDLSKVIAKLKVSPTKPMFKALYRWYIYPGVDQKRLMECIDEELIANSKKTVALCMQQIGPKYNYKRSKKNRIDYYLSSDGAFHFQ